MNDIKKILLALIAVAATVGALWFTRGTAVPQKATLADVAAEAERGGYKLINAEELWELFSKNPTRLLVVDTRQEWEYRTGHIRDAVNFPMEPTWLSRWQKKEELETYLGADKDRTIVFY